MSAAREPLGKHVAPRVGPERLARQWEAIPSSRVAPRGARRFAAPAFAGLAFAGVMAAVALVVLFKRAPRPSAMTAATLVDGTWLESAPSGPSPAVVLADGSRVALGARSRLRLTRTGADDVRLDLERGRVDVQATHRAGRAFLVAARDVEVRVVGTRFSVEADGPVRVRVEEGRVQVHEPGGDRFVSGGEEWAEEAPAPEAAPSGSGSGNASADANANANGNGDGDDAGVTRRSPRAGGGAGDAKGLLDDAQRAIAQGKSQDAARLLDAIRRDHRRDPRAGLAAFELGRLRLDALGDPGGAEDAFRDAIRLARDGGLRDDAEARRVEALDRMGARAACQRARAAYLAAHATGVHRAEVTGWCGGT